MSYKGARSTRLDSRPVVPPSKEGRESLRSASIPSREEGREGEDEDTNAMRSRRSVSVVSQCHAPLPLASVGWQARLHHYLAHRQGVAVPRTFAADSAGEVKHTGFSSAPNRGYFAEIFSALVYSPTWRPCEQCAPSAFSSPPLPLLFPSSPYTPRMAVAHQGGSKGGREGRGKATTEGHRTAALAIAVAHIYGNASMSGRLQFRPFRASFLACRGAFQLCFSSVNYGRGRQWQLKECCFGPWCAGERNVEPSAETKTRGKGDLRSYRRHTPRSLHEGARFRYGYQMPSVLKGSRIADCTRCGSRPVSIPQCNRVPTETDSDVEEIAPTNQVETKPDLILLR